MPSDLHYEPWKSGSIYLFKALPVGSAPNKQNYLYCNHAQNDIFPQYDNFPVWISFRKAQEMTCAIHMKIKIQIDLATPCH